MKLQQHRPSETKGCLVTLHRMCWCLCYSNFTVAEGNLAMLGHAGQQLDIVVFGYVRTENCDSQPASVPVVLLHSVQESLGLPLLCSRMLEMQEPFLLPEVQRKITFVSAHVERMAPHSDVVKPVVQEGPKTWRWYTCQKPSQSSMRTLCLSRHIKQAQINQLWLCKIFLIQASRWLSSIGKSLNSKKGQKAILLHCLLRTTQALSYTFPACTSEVVRALAWFTAQNAK